MLPIGSFEWEHEPIDVTSVPDGAPEGYCLKSEKKTYQFMSDLWLARESTQYYTRAHKSAQYYTAACNKSQEYAVLHRSAQYFERIHNDF